MKTCKYYSTASTIQIQLIYIHFAVGPRNSAPRHYADLVCRYNAFFLPEVFLRKFKAKLANNSVSFWLTCTNLQWNEFIAWNSCREVLQTSSEVFNSNNSLDLKVTLKNPSQGYSEGFRLKFFLPSTRVIARFYCIWITVHSRTLLYNALRYKADLALTRFLYRKFSSLTGDALNP